MLMLLLAETSRNGMPSSSASAWPCSVETARLSSQSHLLPIRILLTPSVACCSTLANQVRISVRGMVSYTMSNLVSPALRSILLCCAGTGLPPPPAPLFPTHPCILGGREIKRTIERPLVRHVVH